MRKGALNLGVSKGTVFENGELCIFCCESGDEV